MGDFESVLEILDAEKLTRLLDVLVERAFEGAADMDAVANDRARLKKSEGFNSKSIERAILAFVDAGLITHYDENDRRVYLAPALLATGSTDERAALLQYVIEGGDLSATSAAPPAEDQAPAWEPTVEDHVPDWVNTGGDLPPTPPPSEPSLPSWLRDAEPAPPITVAAPSVEPEPPLPETATFTPSPELEAPPETPAAAEAPRRGGYGAGTGGRLRAGSGAQKTTDAPQPYSAADESKTSTGTFPAVSASPPSSPPPPVPATPPPSTYEEPYDPTNKTEPSRSARRPAAPPPEPEATPRWSARGSLPNRTAAPPPTPSPETPPPPSSDQPRVARTPGTKPASPSTEEVPERLRNFQQRASTPRRPGSTETGSTDIRGRGGIRGYGANIPQPSQPASGGISEDVLRLLLQSGLVSRSDAENLLIDAPTLRRLLGELQSRLDALQTVGRDNDPTMQINLSELIAQIKAQANALDAETGDDNPDYAP